MSKLLFSSKLGALLLSLTVFAAACARDTKDTARVRNAAMGHHDASLGIAANALLAQAEAELPHLPKPNVKVIGSIMLVDGVPYTIRGVCYNPRRLGKSHQDKRSFIYEDPSSADYDQIWKDLLLMEKAHINTVRVYEPITDAYVLKMFHAKGIKIIHSVINNADSAPVSAMVAGSTLAKTIKRLANHPTTLMLEVGNEWTLNYFYQDGGHKPQGAWEIGDAYDYMGLATTFVKSLAPEIPLTSSMSGFAWYLHDDDEARKWLLHAFPVDVWGMNTYASFDATEQDMIHIAKLTDKPWYLSEFGADRWDARAEVQYSYRDVMGGYQSKTSYGKEVPLIAAQAAGAYIDKLRTHLEILKPGTHGIGGTVFSFADEYGRTGHPYWQNSKGEKGPGSYSIFPDGVFDEEYFGLVSQDRKTEFDAYRTITEKYGQLKALTPQPQ